ncbi:MAG: hypothetical protein WAU81_15765 [Candidatus Aminicenantales bacterium]
MKRLVFSAVGAMAFLLIAGNAAVYAQGIFKIPFKFQAAGQKLPAGDYWVSPKGEEQIALRKEPGGEEILIPFKERLALPETPIEEPKLVFDMVGNFEPSYTEYVTEYLLAELWLPGDKGYLIHLTKGAHKDKIVTGMKATK